MATVYLAGSLEQQEFLLRVKELLKDNGITVTSRWLMAPKLDRKAAPTAADETAMLGLAVDAVEDIELADAVVLWLDGADAGRGGRHWETGFAWGKGKPIVIVGPRGNVFHRLPGVWTVSVADSLLTNVRHAAQLVHQLKRAYQVTST